MRNTRKNIVAFLIIIMMYNSTFMIFAQDQGVDNGDTPLESEEVPEEEIYFVSAQGLLINEFSNTLNGIGIVTLSLGTALALATLVTSDLLVLGNDGKIKFDDGYIALQYYQFHLYDALYTVSITFMSIGVTTLLIGNTFKPATNKEYLQWKKNQRIFGFTTSSIGVATLIGSLVYWGINDFNADLNSTDNSIAQIFLRLGSVLAVLGIPSIILGTTSIL